VWVTAHRHLIGDGTEPLERAAKNANPFCRPRQVLVVPRQLEAAVAEQAVARKGAVHNSGGRASIPHV
jgi:hypothetical protein